MGTNCLTFQIKDRNTINTGPISKEILLQHAENEYYNGNIPQSVFYQTYILHQHLQESYNLTADSRRPQINNSMPTNIDCLMEEMNGVELSQFKNNSIIQYTSKSLRKKTEINNTELKKRNIFSARDIESCSIFSDTTGPMEGFIKIQEICQQFPTEWTILQLCKGPRTESTYSIFHNIHESDAAIYLTLMKHARSHEYPKPFCLRFSRPEQKDLFKSFANIINRFKSAEIGANTNEEKKRYWTLLGELNKFIARACAGLKNFLYPWTFLFTGISYSPEASQISRERWSKVDKFCDQYMWDDEARVLLSLAASNVASTSQIVAICEILSDNQEQRNLASDMLIQMQKDIEKDGVNKNIHKTQHYPCILIIDERLDHFFWEEINVYQEFTRVNSLQCLWRLYRNYKTNIRQGYLNVNITDGCCLLNPDKNLPKMESRMRTFFEYWLPHWTAVIGQRPTQDELIKYLSRSCYVYSGHGSGLQYINGRNITKHQINCVVFLFGCDSSRLHSNGLYSELVGAHLYYQAAMCPALVGTLMPGLDVNMDTVSTEVLSRWIVPKSANVLPWNKIDEIAWAKQFIIKPGLTSPPSMANTPDYNNGSLCAVLAGIHQRNRETKLYNTAPYVCRGLPVWNCNAESLPSS